LRAAGSKPVVPSTTCRSEPVARSSRVSIVPDCGIDLYGNMLNAESAL